MREEKVKERRFGEIATRNGYVAQKDMDRALVVQKEVYKRAKVYMPIGEILVEMSLLTEEQRDEILVLQNQPDLEISLKNVAGDETDKEEPDEDYRTALAISPDKLSATIKLKDENTVGVTLNEINKVLGGEGIRYGIIDDGSIQKYLETDPIPTEPLTIAQGKTADPGRQPEIKYHFDIDPLKIGMLKEDGTIDWKDRGEIPQVKQDDLLAEIIPGVEGTQGIDIYNNPVPPPKLKEIKFIIGSGVVKSADGNKLHSKIDGMPKVLANGELNVFPTLNISGDVSVETGHIDFDGHIEITGSVQDGYRVKGKSLRARELYNAEVRIEEDINILEGIYGSDVISSGNLKASHIHDSTIDVLGNLVAQSEIIESKIETNGKCTIGGGAIISSEIIAKKGILVRDIGTEAAKPSTLDVGSDRKLEKAIRVLKSQIKAQEQKKKEGLKVIEELKERSDKVSTMLGEIAQEQDKYMVQQRMLEDKLKVNQALDDELNQSINTAIDLLATKQLEIDATVEKLLIEEDEIPQKISDMEPEITTIEHSLEESTQKLELLNESLKVDNGVPVLKVEGIVFPGTKITLPHRAMTNKKEYTRVRITEAYQTDDTGSKSWQMKISPLR